MVTFLPFPGFRPALGPGEQIKDRISPPYDVIDAQALEDYQSSPNNITNITLKQDPDGRYHSARKELDRMMADGSLKQDSNSFYLYEQTFDDNGIERTRVGLVGILKTEEYSEGNIIPHEETFSKVKEDRLNLLRDTESQLESIFGIYNGFEADVYKDIIKNANLVYRYVDPRGVEHRYSRISDPKITSLITEEMKIQKMLIADGHHRYETALNYSKENPDKTKKGYVLATLVASDDKGLVIWPTHRMVVAGDISEKNAISKISKALDVKEVSCEEMEKQLKDWKMGLMFKSEKCFLANKTDGEGLWTLDTYIAQETILKGVYKSDEGKSTVSYDAELSSVKKKMASKEYDLAIILNDPDLHTIWDLSMSGKRMPKKTTFFFPKIWSGFVIYDMRD